MSQEVVTLLNNKQILLGVTGSIAVYKAVDLASKLTQAGALVDVIMTESARQFVTPLAFQSVTGRSVYTSMWQTEGSGALPTHIAHVGLGESADMLVIAPATANTLAKLANGLADDLLSVTALAARCPLVVAPAMDGAMYEHPATQTNLAVLHARDVTVIEPEEGRFASGLVGKGRLPETLRLMGHIRQVLGRGGKLAGKRVVVTAGGTREPLDPVRFISNRSSGKQGYALAQAALDAGARVTLITTSDLMTPVGAKVVRVNRAEEMLEAVLEHIPGADALLMVAAVADFKPRDRADQKIKKNDQTNDAPIIELARTPDILLQVKAVREQTGFPRVVVGFAAESEHLLAHAQAKRERKGLDLLIANDITEPGAGFEGDTNRVVILDSDGSQTPMELTSKARVAEAIIERVADRLA